MFATWRTRAVLTHAMVLMAGLSLTVSLAGCHSAPPSGQLAAQSAAAVGRPTPSPDVAPADCGGRLGC